MTFSEHPPTLALPCTASLQKLHAIVASPLPCEHHAQASAGVMDGAALVLHCWPGPISRVFTDCACTEYLSHHMKFVPVELQLKRPVQVLTLHFTICLGRSMRNTKKRHWSRTTILAEQHII